MLYMPFYLGDAIPIQEQEVHLYVYPNGLEPLKHFGQELYHQEFSLQIFFDSDGSYKPNPLHRIEREGNTISS